MVYKDILDELDRNARLKPASMVMNDLPEKSNANRGNNFKNNHGQPQKGNMR
jgi:hypothetical protein